MNSNWEKTNWSKKQANNEFKKLDNIISQLPEAIDQANKRIISERIIKSKNKILSLYEKDIHVIVRGKAGAEVEFGNGFYLAEQEDGLIVDWEYYKDYPVSDSQIVTDSVNKIEKIYSKMASFTGDRGFYSKSNKKFLEGKNIFNGICPKSPNDYNKHNSSKFITLQKRRAQTEGRIGIFKNSFLGKPFRYKGFINREKNVSLSVLTHNLWVISRMMAISKQNTKLKLA